MKIYTFGDFRLVTEDRRLFRSSGEEVQLTPRVFELLLLLIENRGRLLTKDELLDAIWPDSVVEESNLSQNIFVLRKALGESTQNPRFIRTVPTKGYRFIGEVSVVGEPRDPIVEELSPLTAAEPPINGSKHEDVTASRRPRLVRQLALMCLIAALLACVGYGIGRWAAADRTAATEVSCQQLTFQRGTVWNARFLQGSGAVVYNANFNNRGLDLFTLHVLTPEARAMGLTGANLLSLSSKGELAILHNQTYIYQFVQRGTLATVPVDGTAVRDIAENVQEADWSPGGDELAIVRWTDTGNRLEYPIGRSLAETRGYFSWPRISPSGKRIAYFSHEFQRDNRGNVVIIDTEGKPIVTTEEFAGLEGLAWHGDEVWFTASKSGDNYALYALSPDGKVRSVTKALSNLMVYDVAPDGSVLMSRANQQTDVYLDTPGHTDTDISWLQVTGVADLANDGSAFLFTHFGEGSGKNYSVYLRKTDGSPAVKLGDGRALALSPDGRFAVAKISEPEGLSLLPTGAGEKMQVPIGDLEHITGARWLPDGSRLIFTANEKGRPRRSFTIGFEGDAKPVPVTPEGIYGTQVSPDGTLLLATNEAGQKLLFNFADGRLTPVAGLEKDEEMLRWGATSAHVYAYKPMELPIRIYRINTSDGRRELAREIQPASPAGAFGNNYVLTTADAKTTVYGLRRYLFDLYLVKGVQ